MTVSVEFPDSIAGTAAAPQVLRESFAVEAYRLGALLKHQAAEVAGLGRIAFDDLLIRHGVTHDFYGLEEFLEDVRAEDRLHAEVHPVG